MCYRYFGYNPIVATSKVIKYFSNLNDNIRYMMGIIVGFHFL